MLAEFQPEIPKPLGQDMEAFLSPGSTRDPAVGVLPVVFIGEDGLKGVAMQIGI